MENYSVIVAERKSGDLIGLVRIKGPAGKQWVLAGLPYQRTLQKDVQGYAGYDYDRLLPADRLNVDVAEKVLSGKLQLDEAMLRFSVCVVSYPRDTQWVDSNTAADPK